MEDVSFHMNQGIHSGFQVQPFPTQGVMNSEQVSPGVLNKKCERVSKNKVYNRSKGNIKGYGNFSNFIHCSIQKNINLKSTGH